MAIELKRIERDDDIVQVALIGRLDVAAIHEVDIKFHGMTAAQRKHTIVDLTGLDFISSLGMGMFVGCARSLHRYEKKMVLVNPNQDVSVALSWAGIDQAIPVVVSVEEAVAILR